MSLQSRDESKHMEQQHELEIAKDTAGMIFTGENDIFSILT
jgi:hypothetical protein